MSDTSVAPAHDLRDFPDWLDPALVKDLRRGLKMRGFTATYLCLILALTLLLGGAILFDSGDSVMNVVWFPVAITLMLIQPMRGTNAIVEERKLETLPLIQLTRLNAFRILFGKWMALAFQTFLITVSLLPYMVLGHFLGGFEFAQNVLLLLLLTVFSLVLTAVTVALSVVTLVVVRTLATIGIFLFTFQFTVMGISGSMIMGSSEFLEPQTLLMLLGVSTVIGAFLIYYLLSAGASQIALPGTENHSTRRRIVAFIVVALIGIVGVVIDSFAVAFEEAFLLIPLFFVGAVTAIDCLVDPAGTSIRTARQFAKRLKLGVVLAPGWPFGWAFAALMTVLLVIITAVLTSDLRAGLPDFDDEAWGFLLAGIAAIFVPGALAVLLPKARQFPFNYYLLALVVVAALAALTGVLAEISDFEELLVLNPFTNMALADGSSSDTALSIVASCIHLGISATIFVIVGAGFRSKFRKQLADARALPESEA